MGRCRALNSRREQSVQYKNFRPQGCVVSVSNIVEEVRKVEQEANERVEKAKEEAERIIEEAEEEAEKTVEEAKTEAEEEKERELEEFRKWRRKRRNRLTKPSHEQTASNPKPAKTWKRQSTT